MRRPRFLLGGFAEIARLAFDAWRIRRVTAGLRRAAARGDDEAVARWIARNRRALANVEPGLARVKKGAVG